MALQNVFGDVSLEATQKELLAQCTLLLTAILDRLPRVDANDRVVINSSDQGNVTVALAASQTLTTLTTCSTVTSVTTLANQTNIGGKDASNVPTAISNQGVMHIYNNILVSA